MPRTRQTRPDDVLIAIETGVVNLEGQEILIRRGITRAHAGSAIAKAYPGFFKPIDVHFSVEQATAAPGEKRVA